MATSEHTCEAGLFRACGAVPTRKCRCCHLYLCCQHHHSLAASDEAQAKEALRQLKLQLGSLEEVIFPEEG